MKHFTKLLISILIVIGFIAVGHKNFYVDDVKSPLPPPTPSECLDDVCHGLMNMDWPTDEVAPSSCFRCHPLDLNHTAYGG